MTERQLRLPGSKDLAQEAVAPPSASRQSPIDKPRRRLR